MARISLNNVEVHIPIYDVNARSLKHSMLRLGTGGLIRRDSRKVIVQALDGVSLEFREGDRIGLIGRNGAGKTTLLQVLAGVYQPTKGILEVEGRVSALFNMSLGMNMEVSGYENIHIRGLFMGLRKEQIERQAEEIAEFTELGDYLQMPVRVYSAGMRLRLAFAISTSIHPDILLLDEAIGAGDAAFMEKAHQRMDALVGRSSILVLASHSPHIIRDWCNRVVWMEQGSVKMDGEVDNILGNYAAAHGLAWQPPPKTATKSVQSQ